MNARARNELDDLNSRSFVKVDVKVDNKNDGKNL